MLLLRWVKIPPGATGVAVPQRCSESCLGRAKALSRQLSSLPDYRNPYDILGVDPDADDLMLKRAFRKQAMECHPDRAPPDPREHALKRFQGLVEAFERASLGTTSFQKQQETNFAQWLRGESCASSYTKAPY